MSFVTEIVLWCLPLPVAQPDAIEHGLIRSPDNRTTQDIGDGCWFLFVVSSQGFDVRGLDASRISECRAE